MHKRTHKRNTKSKFPNCCNGMRSRLFERSSNKRAASAYSNEEEFWKQTRK